MSSYKNSLGTKRSQVFMLQNDDSQPYGAPSASFRKAFPKIDTAGVLVDDSVMYSDMMQNQRAAVARRTVAKKPY